MEARGGTLVIGLGNPLLADDGVGLHVISALRDRLDGGGEVELAEDYWGGLRLMERMVGYDRVVVVDAIQTGDCAPGTVRRMTVSDLPTRKSASAHDATLPTALALGRQAGAQLPPDDGIVLVAVEVEEMHTFSETCTEKVQAAIPVAVEAVHEVLQSWR